MAGEDFVKDIKNKEYLDSKLQSIDGVDKFDFKKFDDAIEKSFQSFLESNKNQFTGEATKDTVESSFNRWLDKQYTSLDEMKDSEIDNTIVASTTFELQNFGTLVELEFFQKKLILEKDKTQVIETVNLGSTEITMPFFNGIESEKVVDLVNKIDFNEKEIIINLLKDGKVKELQQKIGGTKNGDKYENLLKYGDDGKFGTETYAALVTYIKANTRGSVDYNTQTSGFNIDGNNKSNPIVEINSDGTGVIPSVEINNKVSSDNINTSVEIISVGVENYGGKNVYNCELNKNIDLAEKPFPEGSILEIVPQYDGDPIVEFSKDNKLQYTSKFTGQDNFTVIVKDSSEQEIYKNNIIVNIPGSELEKNNKPKKVEKEIDKIMKTIDNETDYKKNRGIIEEKFNELRKEYQENVANIDAWASDESKKDARNELSEKNNEIEKITKILIVKEAESHLKEYLNKDVKTLETKLNEKCDYYFDGKYISKEKFLNKLDNNKINLKDISFVNLDVDLVNYKGKDSEEVINYLNDTKGDKRNFEITDLILTDDKSLGVGKGLTKDQEIQYKADRYTKGSESSETKQISERKALKRILGRKGLFGRGGVDEDMSIATEDYNTNNPFLKEKKNLRKLKKILLDINDDTNVTVKDKFTSVAKDYSLSIPPRLSEGGDKNQNDLFELYKMYKEDKNCGDYFKKVMGLFENYFLRGIDDFDVVDNEEAGSLFVSIYNQENIGRTEGLLDTDKKRQAINYIFNESKKKGNIELGVAFSDSKELKELKKLVKNIDLSTYLNDPNASKKHKKFASLYDNYRSSRTNEVKDSEGRFVVKGETESSDASDLYYNAVFDFLVGMVEGRQDVVSAVNSIKMMDMLNSTEVEPNEKDYYDNIEEKQFVMLLADFNKDGRVDHGDRGIVMGLTVKNMYKSVKVDQKYLQGKPENEKDTEATLEEKTDLNAPWQNLINFSKILMEQNGDVGLLSDLEKLENKSLQEVLEEIKTNSGLLKYFQNILANSPMPVDYIFRYGADASQEYMNFVLPNIESENLKIEGLEQAFKDEYKKLLEQGLVDSPEIRAQLKPMFYAGVLNNGGICYGSLGTGLTFDAGKKGQFSMNLGYSEVPSLGPVLGIMFSYGNDIKLSSNTNAFYGAGIGSTTKSLFVPMVYGALGIKSRLNPNVDLKSLERKSAHYFSVGGNVSWAPYVGFGGGAMLGWSRDKMKLSDDQAKKIKEALTSRSGVLYKSLEGIDRSKDKENVISGIKQNMAKHFYNKELNKLNNDENGMVSKAAENIYKGISYYSAGLKLTADDPRLATIINEVSEAYAIQWKNDATNDSKDWHISGAGIGVQIIAGYIPIISLVEFTKYKNLYSKETKQSNANYYERLVTGKGMDFVEKKSFYDEGGHINQNAVNYLNAKLSIAHPDVSSPNLDIKLSPTDGTFAGEIKGSLYIPKNLIKYANINIDAAIADYTTLETIDGIEYIVVPANTKIGIMDYSRLNSARFHLFIGDNKAKSNDIKVGDNMVDFAGDPRKYEGYAEDIDVSKEKINVEVKKIDTWVEESQYKETHPFPIKECFKVENKKAIFELKEGFGDKCIDVGGNNSLINKEGDSLTIPQTGTLTMLKRPDGKYYMYYRSMPADKLSIDYQLESSVTKNNSVSNTVTTTIEDVQTINRNERKTSFVDIFSEYDSVDRIFDGIEKDLSNMDNNNPGEYAKFMDAASEIINKSVIDNSNYDTAFDALKNILNKGIDNNTFDALRIKISTEDLSVNDKVMIVDRFKAIFSYHIDLTSGKNNGIYFNNLIKGRGEVYKNLKGYDRSQIFPKLNIDYRSNIVNQIGKNDKLEKIEKNNLFGMTAFYRLGNSHEGRSYSMTQMGSTNVLGGYMENIATNDLEATKTWFLNNLDKSGPHKKILIEAIKKQIGIDNLTLDDGQLKQLLMGKSIDINDKKITISLELDYVFYLLGECANESIGINLKGIKIMEKISSDNNGKEEITDGDSSGDEINKNGRWKVTIKGDKSYESGIYRNTVGSNSQNEYAKKKQFVVGAGVATKKPGEIGNQYVDGDGEGDNQYTEGDNQSVEIK